MECLVETKKKVYVVKLEKIMLRNYGSAIATYYNNMPLFNLYRIQYIIHKWKERNFNKSMGWDEEEAYSIERKRRKIVKKRSEKEEIKNGN